MIQFAIILLNVVMRAAFLGPVLFATWNFAVVKFFPYAPKVEIFDAMILLAGVQSLLIWTLRPVSKEFIPLYIPTKKLDENNEQ